MILRSMSETLAASHRSPSAAIRAERRQTTGFWVRDHDGRIAASGDVRAEDGGRLRIALCGLERMAQSGQAHTLAPMTISISNRTGDDPSRSRARSIRDELAELRDGVRAVRLEQVSRELRRLSRARQAAGEATPAALARALGDIERQLAEARETTARHAR